MGGQQSLVHADYHFILNQETRDLNFSNGLLHLIKQQTTSFYYLFANKPRGMLVEHETNS